MCVSEVKFYASTKYHAGWEYHSNLCQLLSSDVIQVYLIIKWFNSQCLENKKINNMAVMVYMAYR